MRPECDVCNKKVAQSRNLAKRRAGNPKPPAKGTPCELTGRTDQQLVLDHSNDTSLFRAWICDSANRAIGMLGDTPLALLKVGVFLAFRESYSKTKVLNIVGGLIETYYG